jgi:hypothetical protein
MPFTVQLERDYAIVIAAIIAHLFLNFGALHSADRSLRIARASRSAGAPWRAVARDIMISRG